MTVEQLVGAYDRKDRVSIKLIRTSTKQAQEFKSMEDMYIEDLEQEVLGFEISISTISIKIK